MKNKSSTHSIKTTQQCVSLQVIQKSLDSADLCLNETKKEGAANLYNTIFPNSVVALGTLSSKDNTFPYVSKGC